MAGIVLTQTADKESYITFGYVLSPLLAMIGFPAVLKSFSNGVGELEQSCRYNLRENFWDAYFTDRSNRGSGTCYCFGNWRVKRGEA